MIYKTAITLLAILISQVSFSGSYTGNNFKVKFPDNWVSETRSDVDGLILRPSNKGIFCAVESKLHHQYYPSINHIYNELRAANADEGLVGLLKRQYPKAFVNANHRLKEYKNYVEISALVTIKHDGKLNNLVQFHKLGMSARTSVTCTGKVQVMIDSMKDVGLITSSLSEL